MEHVVVMNICNMNTSQDNLTTKSPQDNLRKSPWVNTVEINTTKLLLFVNSVTIPRPSNHLFIQINLLQNICIEIRHIY